MRLSILNTVWVKSGPYLPDPTGSETLPPETYLISVAIAHLLHGWRELVGREVLRGELGLQLRLTQFVELCQLILQGHLPPLGLHLPCHAFLFES